MGAASDQWQSEVERVVDNYADGDRMPEDYSAAHATLVRMGFNPNEARDLLQEATA